MSTSAVADGSPVGLLFVDPTPFGFGELGMFVAAEWRGRGIPDVLLSGHHGKIARWRRDEAFERTALNRPDLIERCDPSAFDKKDREMLSILGWAPDPAGEPYGRFWRRPEGVEQ